MGRCYAYECPKCGLRNNVAGGLDRGHDCFSHTMVCHDCRRLFDAATHVRLPAAAKSKRLGPSLSRRLPSLIAGDVKLALPDHIYVSKIILNQKPILPEPLLARSHSRWVELAVQCPAGTTHRVEPWKDPGRCPCCQAFLDKSFVPYRIWD